MPFDPKDPDPYHTASPHPETYASNALRNNSKGTDLDKEALERFKVREICEGWGSYRDAAEYVFILLYVSMHSINKAQVAKLPLHVLR